MRHVKVILASASPRREELLKQIGIVPEIIPSDIEEKVTSENPRQVVEELSRQKAESVWEWHRIQEEDNFIVIGSDTVVALDGKILGKPKDENEAEHMIHLLQGKSHQVYTGVTLVDRKQSITFSEKTLVFVHSMAEQEIKEYVARGESLDKAGAYGIQGYFSAFIDRIEGSYANVMGLPVGSVYQWLKKLMEGLDD